MDSFVSVSYPQKQQIASSSEVILVTGPHCLEEVSDGAVQVESATCESVKLSPFQPRTIKRVFTPVAAYFDAQDDDAVELQEGTQQRETNSTQELHLDPSREHGYKYAYTQDDLDDQSHILDLDVSTFSTNTFREQASEHPEYSLIHVLGKSYHPVNDYAERRTDECSLLWFTYRCDFPEIAPYRITTDAGWGCMLRSAQMMLGQALRVHFKSRSWQPPLPIAERKMDHFVRSLLTWFADYPSRHECVFSLHNMVAAGLAKYDVLPGEWYGPGTAAYVMRDLAELYEQQRVQHENTLPIFRVYVASQGVVYRDAVNDLMTRQAQELRSKLEVSTPKPEPLHPLDTLHVESCNLKSTAELTWDTALLILIPLRLGLKAFNTEYTTGLAHMFSLPQSVGVIGGRPRGARWFYGASAEGKLYGLDPHTIQMAPMSRIVTSKSGDKKRVVSMTDDYVRSVHTSNPEIMPLARVDPSMTLGFYCKTRDDFAALGQALAAWNQANPTLPEVFTMADAVPDYSASMSSAMNEMMLSITGEEEEVAGNVSDDDEYVLL